MSCFRFPKKNSGDEHSVLLGWVAHTRSVPHLLHFIHSEFGSYTREAGG